jgi:PAS domain S-box-containing protein
MLASDFLPFLRGGGEMGERMRAYDWSSSPLGPPDGWPQALRTAVGILLDCQLPMYIAWGPQYIQFYNDAYRPILGDKHPSALGESSPRTWHEIWDTVGPMWQEVLAGRPIGFDDFKLTIDRYGYPEDCYFNFSYSPVKGDDGTPAGVLVTFAETTRRVRSESRLRLLDAISQATRSVHQPAEVMQITARLLGEWLGVNRCAYASVLEDQDTFDLIGDYNHGVDSIVGRYRFTDFGATVRELMQRGEPYVNPDVDTDPATAGSDLSAYRLTGIRAVICVPLHKGGRFVAAMAVHQSQPRRWLPDEVDLVRTVVDRCWESLARIRSNAEAADAGRRLAIALEAGGLGDWSWDPSSDLLTLSDRAADIYGVPRGQPVTRSAVRALLHPDDREPALTAAQRSLVQRLPYSFEYRLPTTDGGMRWILVQGNNLHADDGTILGTIGVVQDTTARRQQQEQLQRAAEERKALLESERAARAEAERASALKDEFLATLSHELRTPLSAIMGWVHILRRKLDGSATDVAKGIDVIERSTRIQVQLIDDLLDMSRIISGKLRLESQALPAAGFVQAALDVIRPTAQDKGVVLHVDLDEGASVSGDAGRLQQVTWNLLANAVKFTPPGGEVRVTLRAVGGHAQLDVRDTGVGIEPQVLPHIFDRFRQGDGSITRRFGGLGLGLSIVRHLVELHGGTVTARSDGPQRGSAFCVQLPLLDASRRGAAATLPGTDAAGRSAEPPDLRGTTVLVVDDEADARELMRRLLEECGAKVVLAPGAEAALHAVQRGAPDVLVSDIGMPDVDGYELLRRMRKLPAAGGVPAVALTAFARAEDRARALDAGFTEHMAKPLEPAALLALVARLRRSS